MKTNSNTPKNWQPPLMAPSILSADFTQLGEEVKSVEDNGADWLHIDVMDGQFVPNLSMGPMVVKALRPKTSLLLDCHLMVADPGRWIDSFAKAGADLITVHVEACEHLNRILTQIRSLGCKVGISLNPSTPLVMVEEVLGLVDLVLLMSVNPGFGGQKFIESTVSKVSRLSLLRNHHSFLIQVDGGVDVSNIRRLREAGADVFVAGSAVFSASDRKAALAQLRAELETR